MSSNQADADRPPAPTLADLTRGEQVVGVVGAVLTVAVLIVHRAQPIAAVGLGAVLLVSIWLSIYDLRHHRLPNRVVGPLAAAVTLWVVVAGLVDDDLGRAGRAIGMGVAVSVVLLGANLVGGLGMGDVKYGFPVGVVLGWYGTSSLLTAALTTTVAGAVVAVVLLVRGAGRHHAIPYGPAMALGLAVGLLLSAPAGGG